MTRLFAVLSLCAAVHTATCGDATRIARHGMILPDQPGPMLVTNVIRFLATSSYQSTAYTVESNTWQELLESDSYVHVKLDPPRKMMLFGQPPADIQKVAPREEVVIDEIIVPLPEDYGPRHIYARTGTNVVSHTKFSPFVFKQLISEPALQLRDSKVYREYSRLPDPPPVAQAE